MTFINQMQPSFDNNEAEAILEYMKQGGWITEFKKTREFERMIADYTGAKYCSVMCNGTLALVAALIACGVGVGDEVIVPDYTMVATPNAVELIGAKAVFVDINKNNLCMDFSGLKNAINEKTKAVILVSINGRCPSNTVEFRNYCDSEGIYLIEDAAQSLGSFYQGIHLGRFGVIGCFSFSAPKIITTGQGGAIITDDEELYKKITRIRDFGRDSSGNDHYLSKGWNFKFTDVQAIIGIEQMKKLSRRVKRKREIGKLYWKLLKEVKEIELINSDFEETCLWFFDVLCEDRKGLKKYLFNNGIGTREFYPALHSEPAYGYLDKSYPVTENISKRGLWLPSYVELKDEDISYICKKIMDYYCYR